MLYTSNSRIRDRRQVRMSDANDELLAKIKELVSGEPSARIPPRPLQQVIDEFFTAKRAERLSENTLNDYTITLKRFVVHQGENKNFADIKPVNIRAFMGDASLAHLSGKSMVNVYIALSSLWTWAVREEYAAQHVVRQVPQPKSETREIKPLSEEEVKRMLNALDRDKKRNRALILFMIDTGVRASEITELKISDMDKYLTVFGKGSKERTVLISDTTARAIIDYLSERKKAPRSAPLFCVGDNQPMVRHTLRKMLGRIGERAGVSNVHPHRFRHTFAVNYLKNGGDAISLQRLLGHQTLDMVKNYVNIAQDDMAKIHRRASPVENWNL